MRFIWRDGQFTRQPMSEDIFVQDKKKIQNPQPSETEQRTLISSSRRSHENETRNSQSRLVSRNLKRGPCLDS